MDVHDVELLAAVVERFPSKPVKLLYRNLTATSWIVWSLEISNKGLRGAEVLAGRGGLEALFSGILSDVN